nr:hypothetical protein [bacterium]
MESAVESFKEKYKGKEFFVSKYTEDEIRAYYQLFRRREEENSKWVNKYDDEITKVEDCEKFGPLRYLMPKYYKAKKQTKELINQCVFYAPVHIALERTIATYTHNLKGLNKCIGYINSDLNFRVQTKNDELYVTVFPFYGNPNNIRKLKVGKLSDILLESIVRNNIKISDKDEEFLNYLSTELNKHECHSDCLQIAMMLKDYSAKIVTAFTTTLCDKNPIYHTWLEVENSKGETLCLDANLNAVIPKELYYLIKKPEQENMSIISYNDFVEDFESGLIKALGGMDIKQYLAFRDEIKADFVKNNLL